MLHEKASYLEVNEKQKERIEEVRKYFSEMYNAIDTLCKTNREYSLAITKLEEAQFWAIKSISREGKPLC